MIYDIRKLRGQEEVEELQRLIKIYRESDKMDVIIALMLQNLGISSKEYNARNGNGKKEEPVVKINAPPQEIIFCDGDQCEMPAYFELKESDRIQIENTI